MTDAATPAPGSSADPAPAIPHYDLAVVGGGVNGAGIARDAAGRGLKVHMCEAGDLAQATSSASTKLFHGGLRYLEFYEFGLVRKALIERETLIRAMPHISWPLRFVLPHHPGLRPAWLLRLGLFIYDHLGGRKILPATKTLDLRRAEVGKPLKKEFVKGFEYSDGWVMDSRLVVLNARDAAARGATIETRTRLVGGSREDGAWRLRLEGPDGTIREIRAKAVVNAAGPWVDEVLRHRLGRNAPAHIRLVRGSHIVTRKLFDHDRAYIFQTSDGRIVFAIPYEEDFTLVGTTDRDHQGDPSEAVCTDEEADYLREVASQYLARPIEADDVVWRYSGVRPLYDDGAKSATQATRDYVLQLEDEGGALLLNVFGGKITTFRKLAEAALEKLSTGFPQMTGPWTADAPMPGGDMPWDGVPALVAELRAAHPFLTERWARRLARMYGTEARKILAGATDEAAMGARFGWDLTETEVRWLMANEWARTAEDVLWRRSRLGLRFSPQEIEALDAWMAAETVPA